MTTNWMDDPAVAEIDRAKLDFLQTLVSESRALSGEQLLPFLMAAAKKIKDNHISFDAKETETIVSAMRRYAAPEELEKLDRLRKLRGR